VFNSIREVLSGKLISPTKHPNFSINLPKEFLRIIFTYVNMLSSYDPFALSEDTPKAGIPEWTTSSIN
jgi:hypothetical protein